MNKTYLQSIIDKYHLEGLNEQVVFDIKNEVLNIKFISYNQNLVGSVYCPLEFPNTTFKINNTSQLNKLIGILDKEISIEKKQIIKGFDCLFFKDSKYELEYILGDNLYTQSIPKINEPDYGIEFDLNESQLVDFINAKKAVDSDIVVIDCQDSNIIFNIGGNVDYQNKIKLKFTSLKNKYIPGIDLKFNVNYIKSIFNVNKDLNNGKCFISEEGLMKFKFESKDKIHSTYYLIMGQ